MGKQVEFTAKLAAGIVSWEAAGNPAKDHKTKIDKGAKPEKIELRISSDDSARGLELQIDSSRPFQVWEDDRQCPPEGIRTDQIEVLSCDLDRMTIRDLNTGPERTLRYQLNVIDKDGNPHPCDPIILNGGAGPGNLT